MGLMVSSHHPSEIKYLRSKQTFPTPFFNLLFSLKTTIPCQLLYYLYSPTNRKDGYIWPSTLKIHVRWIGLGHHIWALVLDTNVAQHRIAQLGYCTSPNQWE